MVQGFQQQTAKWPVQPVEVAVRYLHGHGKNTIVADFGCGDAQLAAQARQKVHSLDLVSTTPGVIACNMAHTPLGEAAPCTFVCMSPDELIMHARLYATVCLELARHIKSVQTAL